MYRLWVARTAAVVPNCLATVQHPCMGTVRQGILASARIG
jgi:hypothetical protein